MRRKVRIAIGLVLLLMTASLIIKAVTWINAVRRSPLFATEQMIKERMQGALPSLKAWAAERVAAQEWRGDEQERNGCPVDLERLLVWELRPCWKDVPRKEVASSAASVIGILISPAGPGPLAAAPTWKVEGKQKLECIDVVFTRGFRQSGLLIGPPGFKPTELWGYQNRWCSQVWFYNDG